MPDPLRRSKVFSARPVDPPRPAAAAIGAGIAMLAVALAAGPAVAGEADILSAEVTAAGEGRFHVSATVRHADTGWDHYADLFDVLAPDGTVLGQRVLHHPHVEEQPFTRHLRDLAIPAGIDRVTVRAHDSVHGLGGATVEVAVPSR